jgi:hypothetical protein
VRLDARFGALFVFVLFGGVLHVVLRHLRRRAVFVRWFGDTVRYFTVP